MKKATLILIFLGIILSTSSITAQKKFTRFYEEDGISFHYKWKRTQCLKKESPLMLVLMVDNSRENHASITFIVDYYWQGIRTASSEPKEICLKANKKMKGKYRNLAFDRSRFTNEDLFSNNFILGVSGLEVQKVTKCN